MDQKYNFPYKGFFKDKKKLNTFTKIKKKD